LGWRPGPGNLSHKIVKTCPQYDGTHSEPKIQNENNFFKVI